MRQMLSVAAVFILASACSKEDRPPPPVRVVAKPDFDREYLWDQAPATWASAPTLVIAKRDSLYPTVPDAELLLTCEADGSLHVRGDAYGFATDLGGPPQLLPMFGLRSPGVSLLGEPVWEYGGFDMFASYRLHPSKNELAALLGGPWFEIGERYADGDGAIRYPPPPAELTHRFMQRCDKVREAG